MITFSKFGSHGNLGNQLHQLASLIGFSEKYGCELVLPEWKYARYFKHPPKQELVKTEMLIEEPYYHYTPEFWDAYQHDFKTKNVDILGWLQTEKYWEHCKEKVLESLQFDAALEKSVTTKFRKALQKETIAVSIRRGDFITNPNFYFLPMEYYFGALQKFFPDLEKYNVLFFSDDLDYCVAHIKHFPNFYFAKGLSAIEQLCLMSKCVHFIISNSTFSWWGAMLGEKRRSEIVRPSYVFAGELKEKFDIKDCFPERWHIYDHLMHSIDITSFEMPALNRNIISYRLRQRKKYAKKRRYLVIKLKNIFSFKNNQLGL